MRSPAYDEGRPVLRLAASAAPTAHPDAALLALGRALDALWDQERALLERYEWDAPEVVAIEKRCDVIVHQIVAATATTLDGLIVKARACSYCQSGEPFTSETLDTATVGSTWLAGTLVRDLLALNKAEAVR